MTMRNGLLAKKNPYVMSDVEREPMTSDSCPKGSREDNPCLQAFVKEVQPDPEAGGVATMLDSPDFLQGDMASMIEIGASSVIPTQKRGAYNAAALSNNSRVLPVDDYSWRPQKVCIPTFRNGNCMDTLQDGDNDESTLESDGESCRKASLFSSLGQLGEEAGGFLTKKEDICQPPERGASGEMQDELWTMLEAISFASEHMQEELVQAQHRELLLAHEVARLRERDCDLGKEHAHEDGKESQRLAELEKTTERLQDAVLALEKANMVLRGRLESRGREMGRCLIIDEGGVLQHTESDDIGSESAIEITGFRPEDKHANILGCESEGKSTREGLAVKVSHLEKEKRELESELVQRHASTQSLIRNYSTLRHRMHNVDAVLEDVKARLAETKRLNRVYLKELKRLLHRYEDLRLHAGVLEKERGTFQAVLLEKQTLEQELESERAARAEAEQQLALERRQEVLIAKQNEVLSDCDEQTRYQLVDKEKRALEVEMANKDRQLAKLRDQYEPMVDQQDGSAGPPQQRGCPSYPGDVSTPLSLAIHGLIEERSALQRELTSEAAARRQLEVDGLRWEEERLLLSACLCTVEKERNLLQAEMRELHRDYLSLSRRVGVRLEELNHVSSPSTCTITDTAVVSQARSEDALSIEPPSYPTKTSLEQPTCHSVPEGLNPHRWTSHLWILSLGSPRRARMKIWIQLTRLWTMLATAQGVSRLRATFMSKVHHPRNSRQKRRSTQSA
uniref:paramyosin-like isoform X3 n=1 Tax=Myxine glutinosa TaxID=7769 RepID=UPI00358FC362